MLKRKGREPCTSPALGVYVMDQPFNLIKAFYVDQKVDVEHEGQSVFHFRPKPGRSRLSRQERSCWSARKWY